MKGILLAGGKGSRLYPLTIGVNKQLLPVYDKPMVYYPLSLLLLAGLRDILIISTPHDTPALKKLLGDGSQWGCVFAYTVQEQPRGIADAFMIGASFVKKDKVCLILGDNIFYGASFPALLRACTDPIGGIIFATRVRHPEQYGVVFFDEKGCPQRIVEKPIASTSSYAIPGLYFYDNKVLDIAKRLTPSKRGELEITDIHTGYLAERTLQVKMLPSDTTWIDAGTFDNLSAATQAVQEVESEQQTKVGCVEEVALQMGYINRTQLQRLVAPLADSPYKDYLARLI